MVFPKHIIMLSLISFFNFNYSMYMIEYRKAHQINEQLWETLEQSWIEIFFEAYKGLENKTVDNNIIGDGPEAVKVWLKKQFYDYKIKTFQNDLSTYVLLYDESELAGYAVFVLWPDQSLVHVPQIAVMVNHQGKGIGKVLMNAINECSSMYKSIVLTTRILNHTAQSFYKKLGFYQVYESIENIPCDFRYSILLRKDLKY